MSASRLPAAFFSHGSPTSALEKDQYAEAVAQLMRLRGRSHRLVSGIVLLHPPVARGQARVCATALDEQHLTMRSFDEAEACLPPPGEK